MWIWESAAEEWVYGYGLVVAVDCASDLMSEGIFERGS
jgi:hypothetical protein